MNRWYSTCFPDEPSKLSCSDIRAVFPALVFDPLDATSRVTFSLLSIIPYMVPCSVIRRRRSQVDKARHIRHYVEHLADIAVLGGNRGQLDGAAAGGVVRHEPERIERRGVVFSLLPSSRAAAPAVLAACRDCRLPAPRPAAAPQLAPTNSSAEGATAAAPAGRGVGDRREEEGRGGGGGTRAGAAVRHGGPRQPVCVPNSLRWWCTGGWCSGHVARWADPGPANNCGCGREGTRKRGGRSGRVGVEPRGPWISVGLFSSLVVWMCMDVAIWLCLSVAVKI
jgi:hypothetical protein